MFVHGLRHNLSNDMLKMAFEKFGKVTKAINTGKNYGFVTFETEEDARTVSLKNYGENFRPYTARLIP